MQVPIYVRDADGHGNGGENEHRSGRRVLDVVGRRCCDEFLGHRARVHLVGAVLIQPGALE